MKTLTRIFLTAAALASLSACRIEPPLRLAAQDVMVDMPVVITDLKVVWDLDIDWKTNWYYGWDASDISIFGDIIYPMPTNYEVRRYFLGDQAGARHTTVDGFTIYGTSFRRSYEFGYYDLLVWSNIDSEEGAQVVVVDESDLDEVKASTTVTKGMTYITKDGSKSTITAVHNQPEIFYSTYPRDIHISRNYDDYDYYNEDEKVWVKTIKSELQPLVYIYLVQVILLNNEDGKVKGVSGNAALSAFANSTSVNTGHTAYDPCIVYFNTRMKQDILLKDPKCPYYGRTADIIGGKMTTYGLCDMEPYTKSKAQYSGTRADLPNYLYVDVTYINDAQETLRYSVTDQCQAQSHGGIITVYVDCNELVVPESGSSGSLFVPVIEDYEELVYEIPM